MVQAPFDIVEPKSGDSPVLVEVPHAGLNIDAESAAWMIAPIEGAARDADLYVHELFADAPNLGATLLVSNVSRYVVDLNRGPNDYDSRSVLNGPQADRPRGIIWRLTSANQPVLRQPLPYSELRRRRDQFYTPYHQALTNIMDRKRRRFGFAVMLCAHSMPSPRRNRRRRPPSDVVPGSRGRTSAAARWINIIDRSCHDAGFVVRHDTPYKGGFSTGHYGQPRQRWHAVQLEIARRLYMDERTLAHTAGMTRVRTFAKDLVTQLVRTATQQYDSDGGRD